MAEIDLARISERLSQLETWLRERDGLLRGQKHLDEGSIERAYWHYGYATALRDVMERWLARRAPID